MLLSEFFHFTNQGHLEVLVHDFSLVLLLLFNHVAHSVCLVIVLHTKEDLLLLAHLDKILAIALFQQECLGDFLLMQYKLLLLFDFKLLNELKGRSLVVAHVLVPSVRELFELELLSTFDIHELLLLRQSHVLLLALLLGPRKLLKPQLHHLGSSVVAGSFCIDSKLVHDSIIQTMA